MKTSIHYSVGNLVLGLICLGLTGCQSPKVVEPLGGGYEQVTHEPNSLMQPDAPDRISFDFRKPSGQNIVIWPSLAEQSVIFQGKLAVFVGDQAYEGAQGKTMRPRLFLVDAPGLPVDVTDQILQHWAQVHGKSLASTLANLTSITPAGSRRGLAVHLEFWTSDLNEDNRNWPAEGEVDLDWNRVNQLLARGKAAGVEKKDLRWHTPYLELGVELP